MYPANWAAAASRKATDSTSPLRGARYGFAASAGILPGQPPANAL
jgi:hypothetical protein